MAFFDSTSLKIGKALVLECGLTAPWADEPVTMQCDIEKSDEALSTSLKTWAWLSPSSRILLEMLVAIYIEIIQTSVLS